MSNKKYYPTKYSKKKYPQKHRRKNSKPRHLMSGFFNDGFIGNGMNFSNKDQELSAYVEKTIIVRDRYGNVQKARQKYFLNSGKQMRIRVHDDHADFD